MTRCKLAPEGWRCNLAAGHDGPCPAWRGTIRLKLKWAKNFWRHPRALLSVLLGRHV